MRSLLFVLLSAAPVLAQAPAGPEFKVNTASTGDRDYADVASDADGNFVVVWVSSEGTARKLLAQRFDADGVRRGGEFQVHASATARPSHSVIGGDASGGFAVAWADPSSSDGDVFVRRFDGAGAPLSADVRVNSFTPGPQVRASVAADASGNFVVVWASNGVDGDGAGLVGQRFAASGARLGGEFLVNSSTTGGQAFSSVSADAGGNFVVVWASRPSSAYSVVLGQRFAASGARIGGEFQVNQATIADPPSAPTVAVTAAGSFVVAWQNASVIPNRILARPYDAAGVPAGPELLVHQFTGLPGPPLVSTAIDAAGRFTVVWMDGTADGDGLSVRGRRFDAVGAPMGREFQVNSTTTGHQWMPKVASDAAGNVVAAWLSQYDANGTLFDVYAQRFGLLDAVALAVDTVAGGASDGNGVLEPGEGADMRPSWRNNAVGAQALAGTIASFTGPPGATYTIDDGAGSYGAVPAGGTQACLDCYGVSVTAPPQRPALHWDAVATEVINPGDDGHAAWALHLGDSFGDVPRANPFYRFVETLLHRGVTSGCGGSAYCPSSATTREQMAPFVLAAKEGAAYAPAACGTPAFPDVPASSPFCRWIEELARRGVVGGCGGGNYCPTDAVTREQMAIFVLRTWDPALDPPSCTTPMFADVPASSPFCRWIEELARRGVVTGCGGGNYCPTAPVTREQMAVFIAQTFGLTLYGP